MTLKIVPGMVPAVVAELRKRRTLLTSGEVGLLLGFAARTITGWAEQFNDSGGCEGIPGVKLGRTWRFDPLKLVTWLGQNGISNETTANNSENKNPAIVLAARAVNGPEMILGIGTPGSKKAVRHL